MTNVINLYPNQDVVSTLREIANDIEDGVLDAENITLITDSYEVFQMGSINDDCAAKDAIFNMTMGIDKLTSYVFQALVIGDKL